MRDQPERMFVFRLALELGKTVGELTNTMTFVELLEWIAYDRIDPFGNQRRDLGHAIVASTIAGAMAGGRRRYRPKQFMPRFGEQQQQSQESMKAHFRAFIHAGDARRKKTDG